MFEELLASLDEAGVRFVVVGGLERLQEIARRRHAPEAGPPEGGKRASDDWTGDFGSAEERLLDASSYCRCRRVNADLFASCTCRGARSIGSSVLTEKAQSKAEDVQTSRRRAAKQLARLCDSSAAASTSQWLTTKSMNAAV
jgi:hypothetical protein